MIDSYLMTLYDVAGKLCAVGGHEGTEHLNTGEIFDPATNKWNIIAPMATLR